MVHKSSVQHCTAVEISLKVWST